MKIFSLVTNYQIQYCGKILLPFLLFSYCTSQLMGQAGSQQAHMRKLLCKEWIQHNGPVDIGDIQQLKAELVTSISLHDDNSFEYFNGKNITGIWRFNAADSTLALKSKDAEQIFVLVFLNAKEMKLKSYFDKRKTEAGIMRFVANE